MTLKRILQHSSIYLVGTILMRMVGLLMVPLYSHYLSPADYGDAELIELSITLISLFFGLQAIGSAMIRVFFDYEDPKQRNGVISTAVIACTIAGAAVSAVAVHFSSPLSAMIFRSDRYQHTFELAFIAMMVSCVANVLVVWFRLHERPFAFVAYSILYLVLNAGLNVYWIAFRLKGVEGFVLSKLMVSSIGLAFLAVLVLRETGLRFDMGALRRMVVFGTPQILTGVAFASIHFSDRFIVVAYAGSKAVGIYSLTYKFAMLVTYLIGEPFGRVWGTSVYSANKNSDSGEWLGRIASYLTFCVFIGSLAIAVFGAVSIHSLTPPSYWPAVKYLPLLIMGYAMRDVGDFFREILLLHRRSSTVAMIAAGCAVLNLAMSFGSIPRWGVWGAAASTCLTWIVYLVVSWWYATREQQIDFSSFRFAKLAVISAGALYAVPLLGPGNPRIITVGGALIMAGVSILAWYTGYFSRAERTRIGEGFRRFVSKSLDWMAERYRSRIRSGPESQGLRPSAVAEESAATQTRSAEDRLPLVSVVLKCGSSQEGLDAAMSSILEQSYSNLEIIIVAEDSGGRLPFSPPAQTGPVRLLRVRAGSGVAVWNAGIAASRGEYVAFLNSTDRWLPGKLEAQVEVLESNPAVRLVGCDAVVISGTGEHLYSRDLARPANGGSAWQLLLAGQFIPRSTVMARRADLMAEGAFDPAGQDAADFDLWVRLGAGGEIRVLPEAEVEIHAGTLDGAGAALPASMESQVVERCLARYSERLHPSQIRAIRMARRFSRAAELYRGQDYRQGLGLLLTEGFSGGMPV